MIKPSVPSWRPEGLPPVSAAAASATRAAARRLGSAELERSVELRGIGRVTVSGLVIRETRRDDTDDAAFELVRGPRKGRLTLDGGFALRLVAAALGSPEPRVLRPLGAAERGVLAAQLSSSLRALGADVTVRLATPRTPADADWVGVDVDVAAVGTSGAAHLDLPVSWLPTCAAPSPAQQSAIGVTATVVLSATRVSLGELAAAGAGDAVVFDGVAFPRDGVPLMVALRIGPHTAGCRFERAGSLHLETHFTQEIAMPVSSGPRAAADVASATQVLAAAPVDVVIELARLTLRADEVLGLAPGAVVSVGKAATSAVDLTIGGRLWARGELVDVEGELGVRLTEIVPGN